MERGHHIQNIARANSIAIGKETISGIGSTVIGYKSSCGTRADTIVIGRENFSTGANGADIIGVGQTNIISNSLLLGNGSDANIRANGGVCDLGTSLVPFKDIYSNSSLIGTTNSRLINNIVSNTGTSVNGDLCSFSGTSGKVITTSSIVAGNVVTNVGTNVSGNIPSFSGITGKIIQDGGIQAANIVTNVGTNVSGNIPSFSGITGKIDGFLQQIL